SGGTGGTPPVARVTAASASRRPSPKMLLLAAVPPHAVAFTSRAVVSRIDRSEVMLPRRLGSAEITSATTPEACGAAIEVPLASAYPLVGTELRTDTPGADAFGLMMLAPRPEEPRLEKLAIWLLMS